jgi:hypothetical protein
MEESMDDVRQSWYPTPGSPKDSCWSKGSISVKSFRRCKISALSSNRLKRRLRKRRLRKKRLRKKRLRKRRLRKRRHRHNRPGRRTYRTYRQSKSMNRP